MKRYLIIGNSAAGIAAAEAIRKNAGDANITMVSDENFPSYCRCLITNFLAGDIKERETIYRDEAFFKQLSIEVLLNRKAVEIRPKKNIVVVEQKDDAGQVKRTQLEYDFLVLANGASPKFPDIKGIHKKGVFGFRTIDDARRITELLPITTTACVMGGGLIGLKAAYALRKRGVEVKVIVRSSQVLSQVLDKEAADIVGQRLQEHGIEIVTGMDVAEVLGNGDVKAVKLTSGKVIGCSMVVVGKGVAPNIDLVKETGIKTREGILVDEYMRTEIPTIVAAGDICQTYDPALDESVVNTLWPNAVEQGKVAGTNLFGDHIKYEGSMGMNAVEFFDIPVISMGITRPRGDEYQEITRKGEGFYKKLVINDKKLVGALCLGNVTNSGVYGELIRKKIDISSIVDSIADPNFSYAAAFSLIGKDDTRYVSADT